MGSHLYSKTFVLAVVVLGMALSLVGSAFAQNGVVPVPAPLIGAGLPALAILGGGYWLIRKLRQRR